MKRPEGFDPQPPQAGAPRQRPSAQQPRPLRPKVEKPAAPTRPPRRDNTQRAAEAEARRQQRQARAEAKRFRRETRRRRVYWLTGLGILALMLSVLAVAIFSPILALRSIQVDGTKAIKSTDVRTALSGQLGTPIALLDQGEIRSKLSHFILIRSYETEVIPPDTLVVRIVERQAIGVVPHGSGYEQVDPAGVVLAESKTAAGYPIIDIGDAKLDSAAYAAAVKVLLAMPSSVSHQVKSISATTLDNVSITLAGNNHVILWGSSADSDLKAEALARLLAIPQCRSQAVLNVTAPTVLGCGPAQAVPTPTTTPTPSP
ncbi:MAG TPA: FtsQ-type POTRA domain-containing protein [Galbitalea sp.]